MQRMKWRRYAAEVGRAISCGYKRGDRGLNWGKSCGDGEAGIRLRAMWEAKPTTLGSGLNEKEKKGDVKDGPQCLT